jgi:hypothetical protein
MRIPSFSFKVFVFSGVLAGVSLAGGLPSEEFPEIREFISTVCDPKLATLHSYHKFYGEGEGPEFDLEIFQCEKNGWVPPEKSALCIGFTKERAESQEKTQSLFFQWLREKIHASSKYSVISAENRTNASGKSRLVRVRWGQADIVFFENMGSPESKSGLGWLMISTIDGKSVTDLVSQK